MARERATRSESGAQARETEVDRPEERTGDTFADGPIPAVAKKDKDKDKDDGKPEIAATDKAMGANMVKSMNQVNGLDGGKYDLDHGVKYDYNRIRELEKAGRMDLWKDEYRQGHTHADGFVQPHESKSFMRWELKKGHSASRGIQDWLKGVTVAECNSAVVAMHIDTLRKSIGNDKFDKMFGSDDTKVDKKVKPEQRMVIQQGTDGTPVANYMGATKVADLAHERDPMGKGEGEVKGEELDEHLVAGHWYYFCNHPKYLLKHPGGAWQGENSLFMGQKNGERMWSGMGAADKTEHSMLEEMVGAYNNPRDDSDEREMLDRKIKNKDGKYGFIHKRYDPENGQFPDTITTKDVLEAPAATVDGTRRKGGFMPESGVGLDAAKVKATRNERE